ncbi:hypothetical protein K440DRAFT_660423 [Wilcoxina mikolae CBS 423.85]|nr:hypothetical protein K440DRAFT_660423 [Wilcoxina mikolae CBS 423.85]
MAEKLRSYTSRFFSRGASSRVMRKSGNESDTKHNHQNPPFTAGAANNTEHHGDISLGGIGNYGVQNICGHAHVGPVSQSTTDRETACLAAIFLTDPVDDREALITNKGRRVNGTCEWIKSNDAYRSWLVSQPQLLRLTGGPGKGKTMISIFLTEELGDIAAKSEDAMLIYYFCDYKDEKRNTAIAVFRGLMFQLLRKCPKLFHHILPIFDIQRENLFTSFESLWRIFDAMVRDPVIGTTYGVLDGLDECDEQSAKLLTKQFRILFSTSSTCRLSLIVVSREVPECIPRELSDFPLVRLDPDLDAEVSNDLGFFIREKVLDLARKKRYPTSMAERVTTKMRERANGTLLWVSFVIAELMEKNISEVEYTLECLPEGLEGIVATGLMAVAIADMSPDDVMRERVSFCGHLLVINEKRVGLVHQSVKDYLLREDFDPDSRSNLGSALHMASWAGYESVIRLLLDLGAEIDATDLNGRTASELAIERGHEATVQLLSDLGAEP